MERHTLSGTSDLNSRPGPGQVSTAPLAQAVPGSGLPTGRPVNLSEMDYQKQQQQQRYDGRGSAGADPRVGAPSTPVGFGGPPQQQPLAAAAAAAAAVAHVQQVGFQSAAGPGASAGSVARTTADARRSAPTRTAAPTRNASSTRSAAVSATAAAIAADDKARAAAAAAAARKYATAVSAAASRVAQGSTATCTPSGLVTTPAVPLSGAITPFTPSSATVPGVAGGIHGVSTPAAACTNAVSSSTSGTAAPGSATGPGMPTSTSSTTSLSGAPGVTMFQPLIATNHPGAGPVMASNTGAATSVQVPGGQQQPQQHHHHQPPPPQPTVFYNPSAQATTGASVYPPQTFAGSAGSFSHQAIAASAAANSAQPRVAMPWDPAHANTGSTGGVPTAIGTSTQEREGLSQRSAYSQPGAVTGAPNQGGYNASSAPVMPGVVVSGGAMSTVAGPSIALTPTVGTIPSQGSVLPGLTGMPAGVVGTGPTPRDIQDQMSPSALQAIKQISKLRDAQYNRSTSASNTLSDDGNASYSSGEGAAMGRGQGWRSAHRGGAYSLTLGTRSGSRSNDPKETGRATMGQLAAKVQAEEKNRRSRVGSGGGSGGPGDDDGGSVDGGGGFGGMGGGSGGSGGRGHGGSSSAGGGNRASAGGSGAGGGGGGGGTAGQEESDSDDIPSSDSEGDGPPTGSLCLPGTEQTGRWTKDEHELFLRALKKYGKEWKRVACMVRTRTVVQTRTHAQKYFQKLTKAAQGGGIDLDEGGPDLMDIEVHMNTIDSSQVSGPTNSAARTRGGAKRKLPGLGPSPSSYGGQGPPAVAAPASEREAIRVRAPRAKGVGGAGGGVGAGGGAGGGGPGGGGAFGYKYGSDYVDDDDDDDDDDDGSGGGQGGAGGGAGGARGVRDNRPGVGPSRAATTVAPVGSAASRFGRGTGGGAGGGASRGSAGSSSGPGGGAGAGVGAGGIGGGVEGGGVPQSGDDYSGGDEYHAGAHPYYYAYGGASSAYNRRPSSSGSIGIGRYEEVGGGAGSGGGGGGGGGSGGAGGGSVAGRVGAKGAGYPPSPTAPSSGRFAYGDNTMSAQYAAEAGERAARMGVGNPRRDVGGRTADELSGAASIDRRAAPSPPGEGSRKREEFVVAELLANTSRAEPEDMRNAALGMSLSMSRARARGAGGDGGGGGGDAGGNAAPSSNDSKGSVAGPIGLRITNPDLLGPGASAAGAATPWDGEVNDLPEDMPTARGRMTPTEEVTQAFAATYSASNFHAGATANGSVAVHASGAGALHRNISQGQVAGALRLIEEAKAARNRGLAEAARTSKGSAPMSSNAWASNASHSPMNATGATSAPASTPASAPGPAPGPSPSPVPAPAPAPAASLVASSSAARSATPPAAAETPKGEQDQGVPPALRETSPAALAAGSSSVSPTQSGALASSAASQGQGKEDVASPVPTSAVIAGAASAPSSSCGGGGAGSGEAAGTEAAPAGGDTAEASATGGAGPNVVGDAAGAAAAAASSGGDGGDGGGSDSMQAGSGRAAHPGQSEDTAASGEVIMVDVQSGQPVDKGGAGGAAEEESSGSGAPVKASAATGSALGAEGGPRPGAVSGDPLLELVNEVDKFGFTPLMLAASMQRAPGDRGGIGTGPDTAYSLCEALISHGASRAAADTAGNTALHWAAWVGNHLVVRLLSSGTSREDTNRQNEEGDTALHFASRWGGVDAVRVLLAADADPSVRNAEGRVPLMAAGDGMASEGNLKEELRNNVRREFYYHDGSNRTLILHHPDCLLHQPKTDLDWERPERIKSVMEKLEDPSAFQPHELQISTQFDRVSTSALTIVHSGPYIKFVNDLAKKLQAQGENASVPFTPMLQRSLMHKVEEDVKPKDACDTSFSTGSLKAARRAAGAVTYAVDMVLSGRNRNAFCAVRPPGHHAGPSGLLESSMIEKKEATDTLQPHETWTPPPVQ